MRNESERKPARKNNVISSTRAGGDSQCGVCVCVCEREKGREGERERERGRENDLPRAACQVK